jgi:protein-disulfide isomerase
MKTKNTRLLQSWYFICYFYDIFQLYFVLSNHNIEFTISACYNREMVYSPHSYSSSNPRKSQKYSPPKTSKILFFVIPSIFLFGLGVGYLIWGLDGSPSEAGTAQATETEPVRYTISIDDDPFLGPENAPVTLIMFSDYQCTYCQKWYIEVFIPLMKTYEGKIRFVYRDFPLSSIHASATTTAEAANCAGDQEKYWAFFNAVFSSSDPLNDTTIQNYATAINLDLELFNQCLSTHKYQAEVEADFSYAAALGVQSTPTFFINGRAVIGAQPYSVFKTLVDQELSK